MGSVSVSLDGGHLPLRPAPGGRLVLQAIPYLWAGAVPPEWL